MQMNYYEKYLKYKKKYLSLKIQIAAGTGKYIYFVDESKIPTNWPEVGIINNTESNILNLFDGYYVIKNDTSTLEKIGRAYFPTSINMTKYSDYATHEEDEYYKQNFIGEPSTIFSKYKMIKLTNEFTHTDESIKNIMRFLIRKVDPTINSYVILNMQNRGKNSIIRKQRYSLDELKVNACSKFIDITSASFIHDDKCTDYTIQRLEKPIIPSA